MVLAGVERTAMLEIIACLRKQPLLLIGKIERHVFGGAGFYDLGNLPACLWR